MLASRTPPVADLYLVKALVAIRTRVVPIGDSVVNMLLR